MAARSSGVNGPLVGEVVVEAVLDDRADGDLGVGKQLLDRMRQQVRRRVAQDLQALGILVGDDRELGVRVDAIAGVDQLAVDLAGERGARQAGADAGSHLGHRDRLRRKALTEPSGSRTSGMAHQLIQKKSAVEPHFFAQHGKGFNDVGSRTPLVLVRKPTVSSAPEKAGRRDWTRTNDPHHVKVML